MSLEKLTPAEGSIKESRRVGRGPGSGRGKTAARGHKGARSRSGYSRRRGFEGGQMPLIRRVPKRGFNNIFARQVETVNVCDLDRFPEGTVVTPALLVQHGCIRKSFDVVKVLGKGELTKKLVVQAHAFSAGAKSKIESAGGTSEELKA
jgi:large subunit ribosomal protein L15